MPWALSSKLCTVLTHQAMLLQPTSILLTSLPQLKLNLCMLLMQELKLQALGLLKLMSQGLLCTLMLTTCLKHMLQHHHGRLEPHQSHLPMS